MNSSQRWNLSRTTVCNQSRTESFWRVRTNRPVMFYIILLILKLYFFKGGRTALT